jgi:HAD superfamily hydrolase (TIGR01490 family)
LHIALEKYKNNNSGPSFTDLHNRLHNLIKISSIFPPEYQCSLKPGVRSKIAVHIFQIEFNPVTVKREHTYPAAFDLDRTLLSVNSSRLVVKASRKMGLMSKRELRQAIFYSFVYKFDLKDAHEIVMSMMQWIKGLKEAEVGALALKEVVPSLLAAIRPEIIPEIAFHRKNNARLVLLSSALPYLCEPVADHLGFHDVLCSHLEVADGVFTGRSDGPLVFGKEKAVRMESYCRAHQFSIASAWYYGDAYTDRFILQQVGNPVCVRPEIKLGWMARRRGWKIM